MQFLKITATLSDKEWIEGNKNRETYREYKTYICDRTESLNEGEKDVFFITDMLSAWIRGALVKDDKDLCRGVVDFMRIICVLVDFSAPEEIIFTDLRLRLGIAYWGGYIEDRGRIMAIAALCPLTVGCRACSFREGNCFTTEKIHTKNSHK